MKTGSIVSLELSTGIRGKDKSRLWNGVDDRILDRYLTFRSYALVSFLWADKLIA